MERKKHPYTILQELRDLKILSKMRNKGEEVVLSVYVPKDNKTYRGVLTEHYHVMKGKNHDIEVNLHKLVEIPENAERYKDLREIKHFKKTFLLICNNIEWSAWLYKEK